MAFQDLPIKRKVMAVIMLTSVSVLVLTAAAFMVYDSVSYRQTMVRSLSTTGSIKKRSIVSGYRGQSGSCWSGVDRIVKWYAL